MRGLQMFFVLIAGVYEAQLRLQYIRNHVQEHQGDSSSWL